MKILQVINSFGTGGAEKLLLETIPKYRKLGIEMDLLLIDGSESPFLTELKEISDCPVYSLGKNWVYNPLQILRLPKYLKSYDIVHVHLFPAFYWVAIARHFISFNARFIFTEHNTTNQRRRWIFRPIERYIYSKFDKIITISKDVESSLIAHLKFPSERFVPIENGISLTRIMEAKKIEIPFFESPQTDKILLQVSRFYDQKDQKTVIRSLKYLPSSVKLLLVGDGKNLKDMQILTKELALSDRVKFLGERKDVPSLLKTADIILLSSKFEGLSLSSIEGMAAGKPFVASNVPGLRDVVENAGILFPQGDEKSLAKEIKLLLENEEYYDAIAKKCKIRAAKYNIDKMIDKYVTLYNQLIR